ncbi:MAG TPA: TonB-dependent receptor, partial [bacterium]|nr:TonB-dependent receptor [bacterium]
MPIRPSQGARRGGLISACLGLALALTRAQAEPVTATASALSATASGLSAVSPTARLHGRVFKLGSPDPVAGATVQLMGLSLTVSSDAQGFYQLDFLGGPFQLRAYADGFAARIYKVKKGPEPGEDAKLNLSLDSTVYEAGQITVKGHRDRPQVLTTTLAHDEIKRIPGTGGDALRAVQDLPGVTIPSDFSGQILVEGSGPNDNLYLIDNLPWPFPFHLGGIVSTVSSDILDSVDLNSAGFGARWGNALGSVLEGKTAPGQSDRLHVDADISLIMSQLTLQGPLGIGNATFTLAGRRSYLDLVLRNLDSSNFTALPVFWDAGGTLDWHWGPDNHFRLLALSNDDVLGVEVAAKDAPSAQLSGEFRLHNAAATSGLVWTNTSLPHFRSVFAPYAYRVDLDDSLGTGFEVDNHDDIYGVKEEATWDAGPAQEWGFGGGASVVDESTREYFYTRDFSNLGAASPTAASTTVSAQSLVRYAFVQDRIQLAGPLALTLGLRYDKSSKVADDPLNPRVALELKTPGGLLWKAAWGFYSQFPSAIQLD